MYSFQFKYIACIIFAFYACKSDIKPNLKKTNSHTPIELKVDKDFENWLNTYLKEYMVISNGKIRDSYQSSRKEAILFSYAYTYKNEFTLYINKISDTLWVAEATIRNYERDEGRSDLELDHGPEPISFGSALCLTYPDSEIDKLKTYIDTFACKKAIFDSYKYQWNKIALFNPKNKQVYTVDLECSQSFHYQILDILKIDRKLFGLKFVSIFCYPEESDEVVIH